MTPYTKVHNYTLRRVARINSGAIVSTISVTATTALNGTHLSCRDGNFLDGEGEKQRSTVSVFGEITSTMDAAIAITEMFMIFGGQGGG